MARTNMHYMYIKVRWSLNKMTINKLSQLSQLNHRLITSLKYILIFLLQLLFSLTWNEEKQLVLVRDIKMSDNDNDDDYLP